MSRLVELACFREAGYDKAVDGTVAVLAKIDAYLFSSENNTEIVQNWNMDTGFDQEKNKRTYWG